MQFTAMLNEAGGIHKTYQHTLQVLQPPQIVDQNQGATTRNLQVPVRRWLYLERHLCPEMKASIIISLLPVTTAV